MKRWLSRLADRLLVTAKNTKPQTELASIQEETSICTISAKIPLRNKTLGDVIRHTGSCEELDQKEPGTPLLHHLLSVEGAKKCKAPPPLDPSTVNLQTSSVEIRGTFSSNTEHLQHLPKPISKETSVKTGGFKNWFRATLTKIRRKGKRKHDSGSSASLHNVQEYALTENIEHIECQMPPSPEHKDPIYITPSGEVNSFSRHVSGVCESEKISDRITSVLLTRFPHELHRSSESFNESLISPIDPERTLLKRSNSAQLTVPKIAYDSRIFNTIPRTPTSINKNTTDAIVSEGNRVESLHPVCAGRMGSSRTPSITANPTPEVGATCQEASDKRVAPSSNFKFVSEEVAECSKKAKKKHKERKLRKIRLPERVERSPNLPGESNGLMKINQGERRKAGGNKRVISGVSSNRNSSWHRCIGEQDRKARKRFDQILEHVCTDCRQPVTTVNCPNGTTGHFQKCHISPSVCAQNTSVLSTQPDVVVEELVDHFARDTSCSLLTRASYAKSLSSSSNRKTALLLKALVDGQYKRRTKANISHNSRPSNFRFPSPLED